MAALLRVPRRFFDDHDGRGLPSPEVVRGTYRHYWIRPDDPAISDLVSDARFYADPAAHDHDFGARALLAALRDA